MYALIDESTRDSDMPRQAQGGRDTSRPAGAIAIRYGAAAARVRQHRRALQRLVHSRATGGALLYMPRDAGSRCASERGTPPHGAGAPEVLPKMRHWTKPLSRQWVACRVSPS